MNSKSFSKSFSQLDQAINQPHFTTHLAQAEGLLLAALSQYSHNQEANASFNFNQWLELLDVKPHLLPLSAQQSLQSIYDFYVQFDFHNQFCPDLISYEEGLENNELEWVERLQSFAEGYLAGLGLVGLSIDNLESDGKDFIHQLIQLTRIPLHPEQIETLEAGDAFEIYEFIKAGVSLMFVSTATPSLKPQQ